MRHEPPEVAWTPPEPAVGGGLGLKPPDPEEPGAGVDDKLAPGLGDTEPDGAGSEPDERVPDRVVDEPRTGAGSPVLCAGPGMVTARAPAVTTLATATVVVIEPILASARSLAATARRISSRRELLG